MDATENLPDCDLNHTARQRCSSWQPDEPTDYGVEEATPKGSSRRFRGCIFVPLAVLGVLVMLVTFVPLALWAGDLAGLDIFPSAPQLPAYAHPPSVEKEDEVSSPCNLDGRELCRHVYFHLPEDWATIRDDVAQNLTDRGWTIRVLPRASEDYLSASSPTGETCLRYSALEPGPFADRPLTYKQILAVVVSPCSFD